MTESETEKSKKQLTFIEHFDENLLQLIHSEKLPLKTSQAFQKSFLYDSEVEVSRFVLWSLFTGVFVPNSDELVNMHKYSILRENYLEHMEMHINKLSEIESNDFENPLSKDYRLCFELETKNQIKVDIVRIGFQRETIQKHTSLLFRVLYYWSMENDTIGYRQGALKRNERNRWVYFSHDIDGNQ